MITLSVSVATTALANALGLCLLSDDFMGLRGSMFSPY